MLAQFHPHFSFSFSYHFSIKHLYSSNNTPHSLSLPLPHPHRHPPWLSRAFFAFYYVSRWFGLRLDVTTTVSVDINACIDECMAILFFLSEGVKRLHDPHAFLTVFCNFSHTFFHIYYVRIYFLDDDWCHCFSCRGAAQSHQRRTCCSCSHLCELHGGHVPVHNPHFCRGIRNPPVCMFLCRCNVTYIYIYIFIMCIYSYGLHCFSAA